MDDKVSNQNRRKLLQALGVGTVVAGAASITQPAQAASKLKTSAHIVILGSGLGGIARANRLSNMLDGAKITIVDGKEEHNYQPGYTLVASGVWPVEKVRDRNADFHPSGITWVKEMVAEIDAPANTITTSGGQKIKYDYLVVATGLVMDWNLIEGMDLNAIGSNGLASVYPSPQAAEATWKAMQEYVSKGGQAVMTLPATALKCAGAPLKMTFMVCDRLKRAGMLDKAQVMFKSGVKNIFGVKAVNDNVLARWEEFGVKTDYESKLVGVDIGGRKAYFETPAGRVEQAYDFLHAVPPMRAPDAVKNSDLAWKEGPMAGGGWLEVDKATLQHKRYPNVFGIGDVNGTPRGKTAATVKKSAPLVAHHLVQTIAGQKPDQVFDGYTSCPMLIREGSAMLIEFDYDGKLIPSLPMIDPLQESYMAWLMKYRLLKPAYVAVLKGRV